MSETCRVIYDNKSYLLHQVGTSRHYQKSFSLSRNSDISRYFVLRHKLNPLQINKKEV